MPLAVISATDAGGAALAGQSGCASLATLVVAEVLPENKEGLNKSVTTVHVCVVILVPGLPEILCRPLLDSLDVGADLLVAVGADDLGLAVHDTVSIVDLKKTSNTVCVIKTVIKINSPPACPRSPGTASQAL